MIDQKVHHVGVQGIAAHARCPRQADQRIDQIDEHHLNARQFAVVIGDMKGRMLLDRLFLPLCECILECSCVEPQGEALAVICIGSPLAEIIAVGAEAADEEVTGGFDARIEVEPLEHAREGRNLGPRIRGSRFQQAVGECLLLGCGFNRSLQHCS